MIFVLLSSVFIKDCTHTVKWEYQDHWSHCKRNQSNLGDDVVSEFNVMGHHMGQTGGDQVNVSLDLVDHSIRVGHVASVLHAGVPVSSNHMVNLFLDLNW